MAVLEHSPSLDASVPLFRFFHDSGSMGLPVIEKNPQQVKAVETTTAETLSFATSLN